MRIYILFSFALISALMILPAYNFWADWYGVFQGPDENGAVYINKEIRYPTHPELDVQHPYLRTKHIHELIRKYNKNCIVVMGSSRVKESFDVDEMSKIFKLPFIKYEYSRGTLADTLHNIKLLEKKDLLPTRLLISIDDISLFQKSTDNRINRVPPPIDITQNIEFWKKQLFRLPTIFEIKESITHKKNTFQFLTPDHGLTPDDNEHHDLYLLSAFEPYVGKYYVNDNIQYIKEILEIVQNNNTKVDFYYSPRFVTTYLMRDHQAIHEFKMKLAKLTPFYDFSGIVHENISSYFWMETSHYSTAIGRLIGNTIQGQKRTLLWGKRVTENNVEVHLADLKRNLANNFKLWLRYKPDAEFYPNLCHWLYSDYVQNYYKISDFLLDGEYQIAESSLQSVQQEVSFTLAAMHNVEMIKLNIKGPAESYFSNNRDTMHVRLDVNGEFYAKFIFGVDKFKYLSNEKTITIFSDFDKKTVLTFFTDKNDNNFGISIENDFYALNTQVNDLAIVN